MTRQSTCSGSDIVRKGEIVELVWMRALWICYKIPLPSPVFQFVVVLLTLHLLVTLFKYNIIFFVSTDHTLFRELQETCAYTSHLSNEYQQYFQPSHKNDCLNPPHPGSVQRELCSQQYLDLLPWRKLRAGGSRSAWLRERPPFHTLITNSNKRKPRAQPKLPTSSAVRQAPT